MANTFNEIINAVYYKMSQKSTSTTYDLTSLVKPKINSVIQQLCRGEYSGVTQETSYKAGRLPFLEAKKEYNIYNCKELGADMTIGDTEITVDATNYPDSGAVEINGNIINYTGKSATQLTGCTNVLITTTTGNVNILYSFPGDIEKPFKLTYWNDGEIELDYINSMIVDRSSYYTIIYDAENTPFIKIKYGQEGLFWLYYQRVVEDLEENTDLCILPSNYGLDVVAVIVAGELLRDKEQVEHAQVLLANGYKKLVDMYSYYSRGVKETQKSITRKKKPRLF